VVVIIALASGLAARLVDKIPQDIKADIVQQKPPDQPKTPPPPPPDLVKPPPAVIPPPDIVVSNEAPTNTITAVTNQVQVPPKPTGVTAPVLAAGRGNNCASKYYPALAVRLNHEGSTVVTVHVGADGSVENVDVATPSGFNELDQAAVECVQHGWHFQPAMQSGTPVAGTKQYRIVWKLTG
jgi:protein TonB